jgi:hypothetical protein
MSWSQDSVVSIPVAYELDGQGMRVQFPAEARGFSLVQCIQTGSEVDPFTSSVCIRVPWEMKKTTHLQLLLRLIMHGKNLHFPIHLDCVMLNKLSTGTTVLIALYHMHVPVPREWLKLAKISASYRKEFS